MRKIVLLILLSVVAVFVACRKDVVEHDAALPSTGGSRVVLDLDSVPYSTLSHYQFFDGAMANMQPVEGVLPYEPINALFTDYAHKKRFIWMPAGVQATYDSDSTVLDFPDGTVLIKNFYYDHVQPLNTRQILETRLMIRKNGQWIFADYIWNAEQTEATFDLNGSLMPLIWMDGDNVSHCLTYRIPSEVECATCHKLDNQAIPIGPKPQNINSVLTYSDGAMNQLAKWEQVGYLASGYPTNINTVVKWDDVNQTLTDRVRAYVDINCSHCHSEGRHCDYRPMRLAWNSTTSPTNLGVCVVPEDPIAPSQDHIVTAGNAARSMLYYRINSNEPSVRMPLMGRTVLHEEAVQLIADWINSISPPCQ